MLLRGTSIVPGDIVLLGASRYKPVAAWTSGNLPEHAHRNALTWQRERRACRSRAAAAGQQPGGAHRVPVCFLSGQNEGNEDGPCPRHDDGISACGAPGAKASSLGFCARDQRYDRNGLRYRSVRRDSEKRGHARDMSWAESVHEIAETVDRPIGTCWEGRHQSSGLSRLLRPEDKARAGPSASSTLRDRRHGEPKQTRRNQTRVLVPGTG